METDTMANPKTEEGTVPQEAVTDAIFGSTDNFFADLDREVNGAILDSPEPQPVEESVTQAPVATQGNPDSEENKVNYEKRYQDSSREAQSMKAKLDEVEPFMPLLTRMNEDEGLVETVKDYLVNGKPSTQLEIPEDFDFDLQDAISDQKSDSAKYFNSLMDNAVSQKVNNIMGAEKEKTQQVQDQKQQTKDADDFKSRMNINDDQFSEMMTWANKHNMTYDDLYYMKNRDKISTNVSNATRKDMLNQMQTVREIPTSQSNVNSVQIDEDPNRAVLDAIKGLDGGTDNLFG
jgi:hypothetical protein|tara:strand:+ start:9640 stop:10512 length:873 start_codon:yes stop_codon:yes gene_type:complete